MKNERQQKILSLIDEFDIDTQETLIVKLKEAGFNVTQTTISRDINQLKLVKAVTARGTYKYIVPDIKRENNRTIMNSVIIDAVLSVEAAKNIVVVKTLAGMANAVAVCVDSFDHDNIVGCVAGDDTIIIVTREDNIAKEMELRLKDAFKNI